MLAMLIDAVERGSHDQSYSIPHINFHASVVLATAMSSCFFIFATVPSSLCWKRICIG
jgi:hypothetical protein